MSTSLFPNLEIQRDAAISQCGKYRWSLNRWWDDDRSKPWVGWIALNASKAGKVIDDPTAKRTMNFSRSWGYAGMRIVNAFGLIATDPTDLIKAEHPIAPPHLVSFYNAMLIGLSRTCPLIVCAWGNEGTHLGRDREVIELFKGMGIKLHCLGATQGWRTSNRSGEHEQATTNLLQLRNLFHCHEPAEDMLETL